jgi:hypothetical protein
VGKVSPNASEISLREADRSFTTSKWCFILVFRLVREIGSKTAGETSPQLSEISLPAEAAAKLRSFRCAESFYPTPHTDQGEAL